MQSFYESIKMHYQKLGSGNWTDIITIKKPTELQCDICMQIAVYFFCQ